VAYAEAFAAGLRAGGIVPVIKHFPGHGHSSGDSHNQIVSTPPLQRLEQADLVPFERLAAKAPAMMIGHLDVPGLTEPGRPASLSPAALTLLRGSLAYQGYIVTDDLSMAAVIDRFSSTHAAVLAIAAGADGVLITPSDTREQAATVAALRAAVNDGAISMARLNDAIRHVTAIKGVEFGCTGG
jgi:beta-N-acetylhexosaminidase